MPGDWRPGYRHQVRGEGDYWVCETCNHTFGTWPPDTEACPGPQEAAQIDWQVVDDLVADGWSEYDARRFATGRSDAAARD